MKDPEKIIELCADTYHISVEDLKSVSRQRRYVEPRNMSMYIIRHNTRLGLADIGRLYDGKHGYKDHSAVVNAIKAIDNLMDTEPEVKEIHKQITEQL